MAEAGDFWTAEEGAAYLCLPQSTVYKISQRVLKLVYSVNDMRHFAEVLSYHGEPFRWDEDRCALLRAELDAYYARL